MQGNNQSPTEALNILRILGNYAVIHSGDTKGVTAIHGLLQHTIRDKQKKKEICLRNTISLTT